MADTAPETLPEQQLNELLRCADWRFLLRQAEPPRIADLTAGRDSQAIELIGCGKPVPGAADVAVIGYPTRLALGAARDALRLGGEVVCLWRLPRVGGSRRAAARLRRAGLADVRVFWPGPSPRRAPQFWLQLGSPAAAAHLLAQRPPGSPARAILRPLWRAAARLGLLAPLCAIGRLPDPAGEAGEDEVGAALPAGAQLLLTGGRRSINKVVGLPFIAAAPLPAAIAKFSRVAAADAALEREAEALRAVEQDRPGVSGVPRLLGQGRRVGRLALAESAVHGSPLIAALSPQRYAELAGTVGGWLTGLADDGDRRPPSEWWDRLVEAPLAAFQRDFGAVVGAETTVEIRSRLEGLGELPEACEHRDCSPWNVVLRDDGTPGLLDWESAEPHGLPGLDLAYFLANAAFVLDRALESGRTRESYARLLDPTTPYGAAAQACAAEYCSHLAIAPDDYARLRLLCWIVHSRSDYRHLEMAAAGQPNPEALRSAMFLGLIEEELRSIEAP